MVCSTRLAPADQGNALKSSNCSRAPSLFLGSTAEAASARRLYAVRIESVRDDPQACNGVGLELGNVVG
jgi:hypothetical protein